MNLNAFAAETRLQIFEELQRGAEPTQGEFDSHVLEEGKKKGAPQMGSTRHEPEAIVFEFVFSAPQAAATVLSVRIAAPERIVFLPVPEWVVESIWQGEVDGSFHFESEAQRLVEQYRDALSPEQNLKWFERRMAKRRE